MLKKKWKKQVEEKRIKVGLSSQDAPCQSKWIARVSWIATRLR